MSAMKLILEAIKSLFRKVENAISQTATALGKRIDKAQSTANTAKTNAIKANTNALTAQEAAQNAQTTANAAQTTANASIALTSSKLTGTLPISKGGTGASTGANALKALGFGLVTNCSWLSSSSTVSISTSQLNGTTYTVGSFIVFQNLTARTASSNIQFKFGNTTATASDKNGKNFTTLPVGLYLIYVYGKSVVYLLNYDSTT